MILSQAIAAAVDDLIGSHEPPTCVSAEEGAFTFDLELTTATAVGVECRGFNFSVANRAEGSLDDLKAWGNRLAKRVTYLMEPLAVQEADPLCGEVLLRSQSPTLRNARRAYYEVRLSASGLNFRRVAFDEATRTSGEVSCQFTRETLERLVDDLGVTA